MSLYQLRNLKPILRKIEEICEKNTINLPDDKVLIKFLNEILTKEQSLMLSSERQYKKEYRRIIEGYIPK